MKTKQKRKLLLRHNPYTTCLLSMVMEILKYIANVGVLVVATRNTSPVFASTNNYTMVPCPAIYPHFIG